MGKYRSLKFEVTHTLRVLSALTEAGWLSIVVLSHDESSERNK